MVHDEFMQAHQMRQRYWARSTMGYASFGNAQPNDGHRALAKLEAQGRVRGIITQNVDGLHSTAGSFNVIDLHGRNDRAVCMECGLRRGRRGLHRDLQNLNSRWIDSHAALGPGGKDHTSSETQRPDGDAELGSVDYESFQLVPCARCGGVIKPDVVFFGDNVPRDRVDAAYDLVDGADLVLVAGSSLMVYSAFRFVAHAHKLGKPVAVVNQGFTRAEKAGIPILKVEKGCSEALARLAGAVERQRGSAPC